MPKRRTVASLRAFYGFDLPDELHAVWAMARQIAPDQPLAAFERTLGVSLVGPFDVLAGRFSGRRPPLPPVLHWRYRHDPPEFLTLWTRSRASEHVGIWMDEGPGNFQVACLYSNDDSIVGQNLFEALRVEVELAQVRVPTSSALETLRDLLAQAGGPQATATGPRFLERLQEIRHRRQAQVTAHTLDRLGVVVPRAQYRPLSVEDDALWDALSRRDAVLTASWVSEAEDALACGFPGTALKLGRDLWRCSGDDFPGSSSLTSQAASLLTRVYEALGRPVLSRIVSSHSGFRWLRSVNILDYTRARVARERAAALRGQA